MFDYVIKDVMVVDGSGKEQYRADIGIKGGKIACIGYVTDEGRRVILFDSSTIRDTATYENPIAFPEGIPHVFVNGELVVDQYRVTGRLPGQVLRRSSDLIRFSYEKLS